MGVNRLFSFPEVVVGVLVGEGKTVCCWWREGGEDDQGQQEGQWQVYPLRCVGHCGGVGLRYGYGYGYLEVYMYVYKGVR